MSPSEEVTGRDTLKSIADDMRATLAAAERAANAALEAKQASHDLGTYVQGVEFKHDRRITKLELIRFPVRFPWLSLLMGTLSLVAVMLLAWKVFR